MKHLFVPYELAFLAQQKEFNEECIDEFCNNDDLIYYKKGELIGIGNSDNYLIKNTKDERYIAAPLYQQLVDWFEEKHNLQVYAYKHKETYTGVVLSQEGNYKFKKCKNKNEALNLALTQAFKLT